MLWTKSETKDADGTTTTTYSPKPTPGSRDPAARRPARRSPASAATSSFDKLNFLSLMLALFCGTASLPHILIRYYTVKDEAAARKSTIVGIASIGFFYVLTLYLGLGAMTSGALDVTEQQHGGAAAGPELQRAAVRDHLGDRLHDGAGHGERADRRRQRARWRTTCSTASCSMQLTDHEQGAHRARSPRSSSASIAIVLGILFEEMNVSFLVGWAFSVAAVGQSAGAGDAAVLEGHDEAGNHRRGHRRHGQLARLDSAERRHLRERLRPRRRRTPRCRSASRGS